MPHSDGFGGGFHILERFKQLPGRLSQGFGRLGGNFIAQNVRTGQELAPYGQPNDFLQFTAPGNRTAQRGPPIQYSGSRNTGAGYNGPGANRSVRQAQASASWANVQTNIAAVRYNELKAGLEQLRAAQAGGGGGASGIIDARIGRAKDELAEGNKAFESYFEDIAPGFEEALDSAKGIAEAEAAIEAHFEGTQEAVDDRYATAEGAVLAIADSMGNTSLSLQEALHTSVFEFKEFIDEDLHLEANQSQALNAAASSLAQAAAESSAAQARGAGARDQFSFQKRYEKIIQNLLDQRAAASSARGNSLRAGAQQLIANYRASQPYTRQQMGTFVMNDMVNQIVPPAQQAMAYAAIETMRQFGINNWNGFRDSLHLWERNQQGVLVDKGWENRADEEMWRILAPFSNVIESAISRPTQRRIDELYNQSFENPQTDFDRFNVRREEAFDAGFSFQDATNYSNQQLITDGTALTDLGAILDQLEADGFGDLFGRGLGS